MRGPCSTPRSRARVQDIEESAGSWLAWLLEIADMILCLGRPRNQVPGYRPRMRHHSTRGAKRKTNMLWSILGITAPHRLAAHGFAAFCAGARADAVGGIARPAARAPEGDRRDWLVSRFLRYLRAAFFLRSTALLPSAPRSAPPGASCWLLGHRQCTHDTRPGTPQARSPRCALCDAGRRHAIKPASLFTSEPEFRTPLYRINFGSCRWRQ